MWISLCKKILGNQGILATQFTISRIALQPVCIVKLNKNPCLPSGWSGFYKFLTETSGTFTGFFIIKVRGYTRKQQQLEPPEYFFNQFGMASPTFLSQVYQLVAKQGTGYRKYGVFSVRFFNDAVIRVKNIYI